MREGAVAEDKDLVAFEEGIRPIFRWRGKERTGRGHREPPREGKGVEEFGEGALIAEKPGFSRSLTKHYWNLLALKPGEKS